MRVPLSWIREFAPVDGDPAIVADALNEAGLVVDALDVPGREIDGVIVARVLDVVAHPNADKLTLVDVDFGSGTTRVVCGARNLAAGDVVPFAPAGASLPGGFKLEARKIRGELSDGMLCSARELGLGDDHEGILHLAPGLELGNDVRDALGLDDAVFELDITPNRPDAMSVIGVARDLAAKLGTDLTVPEPDPARTGGQASDLASVVVEDTDRCPRYLAMTGTVAMGASPDWMARRLTLAGMRPISNVVDVTNYVLLERGQPLHAFDHARLGGGGIRVRLARPGETLATLDGIERTLEPSDLLICDADDQPQALAGIMGGATSEVGADTTTVLLESAYFSPEGILRTSKRLGLRSESSARFERGTDPNGVDVAARRAWELFGEVAGGGCHDGEVDVYPDPVERDRITVRIARVNAVLGTDLDDDTIVGYLEALDLGVTPGDAALTVEVPTYRPDLEREIDVVEEVARMHGYNNVARTVPRPPHQVGGLTPAQRDRRHVRQVLMGRGFSEAMTLSLIAPADLERAGHPGLGIELENPLRAEESLLRTAVLPGLLRSVAFNAAHGTADVALFEVGKAFLEGSGDGPLPDEREKLAAVRSGVVRSREGTEPRPADVHDMVGAVEAVVEALELADVDLVPERRNGFHPGRCAAVFVDGVEAGQVGELAPDVVAELELPEPCVALELDLQAVLAGTRRRRWFSEPSRYPFSSVDLAFSVPEGVTARRLQQTLVAAGGEMLERVQLVDVFAERSSLTYRLTFRAPDRTLTDDEIAAARSACIEAAQATHGAELRGG